MAQRDCSTGLEEMLQAFQESENPLQEMMKWLCQKVMEVEISQQLKAEKSERTGEREGYRSGYRNRRFDTRLGSLMLAVPKVRNGGYVPFFVKRRQRSEEALILAVCEIYTQGVSTRKVAKLMEALDIQGISAGEISNMTQRLDEQVQAFRTRSLKGKCYPFLWVDALYEDVRRGGHVVSTAVEVVVGADERGRREVLAIEPMAEESKESYLSLFRGLKERGLRTPELIISDAHSGLYTAIKEGFPGAAWQRCKVHFMRNILAHIPQSAKEQVAAELKLIWLTPTMEQARSKANEFCSKYRKKYPEAVKCLEDGLEDSLTFYTFPTIDTRKIATSNMIERLNEEIRRRTRVVGIFPNVAAYVRLVTVYLLECTEDWSSGRSYISEASIARMLEIEKETQQSSLPTAGLDRTSLAG